MKIKIDRKEIDNAIKNMDLFPSTKEVIKHYQESANKLDIQEKELLDKLEILQKKLTDNLREKDVTDDVGKLVYLSLEGKRINSEADVISSMLEQIEEKKLAVKFHFVPLYHESLKSDYQEVLKYNANSVVEQLRYSMLRAVADLSSEMAEQFEAVAPAVFEVYETPEIIEKHPALKHTFYKNKFVPLYEESNSVVISKNDIFTAVEAGIVNYPAPTMDGDTK